MNAEEDTGTMTPDPVFAAIAAHRSAWVAVMGAMDRADNAHARKEGRTVTPADVEAKERADRALDDAMAALKQTQPVTMAGLSAAIAYLIEWDEGQMGDDARAGIQTLLRTPLFEGKPRENVARDVLFDLEDEITRVERVASIAEDVILDALHEAKPDEKREQWSLTLSMEKLDQLLFLPPHVNDMAKELRTGYEAGLAILREGNK
jgi:hypothetical protein